MRNAIEEELTPYGRGSFAAAAAALSQRYRDESATGTGYFTGAQDVAAYVAYRMPATYAAVRAALAQAAAGLPGFAPQTLLDVGAGPGTAAWAALAVWPGIPAVTLLEREPAMAALGSRLAGHAPQPALRGATWLQTDLGGSWQAQPHGLVTAAYVLGELPEAQRPALLRKLWEHTGGLLVLVEPGTQAGAARILRARSLLLAEGAFVAAPCPHGGPCPAGETGWCHFSQRIARSGLHRQAKGADLAYEDEKYAFLALSRRPGAPCAGRVLRHPLIRKGHIVLEVCTPEGIESITVGRSQKERYRLAKNLRWGSELPPEFKLGR